MWRSVCQHLPPRTHSLAVMWNNHLFISVCADSEVCPVARPHPPPLFLHHTPLPYLIKLIQSGACARAGPHYLHCPVRDARWPHRVFHRVLPAPPTEGAADPTPFNVPPPPEGAEDEQLVGGIIGSLSLLQPPTPSPFHMHRDTQELPAHRGICPPHFFNMKGLNIGSQDLQGSFRRGSWGGPWLFTSCA